MGEHAGFARARAGQDEQGPIAVGDGFALRVVEPREQGVEIGAYLGHAVATNGSEHRGQRLGVANPHPRVLDGVRARGHAWGTMTDRRPILAGLAALGLILTGCGGGAKSTDRERGHEPRPAEPDGARPEHRHQPR